MPFPSLPVVEHGHPWPVNIEAAHAIMSDSYAHISAILQQENFDPVRLNHHASTIINDTIPILEALENDHDLLLPQNWFASCATALAELLVDVLRAAERIDGTR
jgi:hypothetical protein